MRKVDDILVAIYGDTQAASKRLHVGPSAISNWRTWGYFPVRLILTLAQDARNAGFDLPIDEIPISPKHKSAERVA